jgi:hypothetical protein
MTTRRSLLALFGVALPALAFTATAHAAAPDTTTQPHQKKTHKHSSTASSTHKHHGHHTSTTAASAHKPAAAPKAPLPQS